jgi:di/tricarboxylate transporter
MAALSPSSTAPLPWRSLGLLGLSGAAAAVTALTLSPALAPVAALAVWCVGSWATQAMPDYWTALAFLLVALIFKMAPVDVILSGFRASTFWLLFSGLVLGVSFTHTGLGDRAAHLLSRLVGRRYSGVIAGLVLAGVLLSFVMPSAMGRIVLLMPLVLALATRLGYGEDSRGRVGMVTAAAFGTWLPAFAILPSNTPNMILAGMAEAFQGEKLSYGPYLLLHFPVLGVVKAVGLVGLILWICPDRDPAPDRQAPATARPLASGERRLLLLLVLCLGLWMTDGLHHVAPGWIGLAAALVCLAPGSGLTPAGSLNGKLNHGSLFFLAGIMGLGAVIAASGLGEALAERLGRGLDLEGSSPLWSVVQITGLSTLVGIVTSLPGIPTVMTPAAARFADLSSLPVSTILMTQVLAFSNILLPYQAPPLITAMQLGRIPMGTMVRVCLSLFALTSLMVIPLDLLWWRLLGWL